MIIGNAATTMAQTTDRNGNQYIFAYQRGGEWLLPQHRFQILKSEDKKVAGQYLTSNWFAQLMDITKDHDFMIIGIHGHFKYSEIKEALDSNSANSDDYSAITTMDREANVVFKDAYRMTSKQIINCINNGGDSDSMEMELNGNQGSDLVLRVRKYTDKEVYITLPSFAINQ